METFLSPEIAKLGVRICTNKPTKITLIFISFPQILPNLCPLIFFAHSLIPMSCHIPIIYHFLFKNKDKPLGLMAYLGLHFSSEDSEVHIKI